MTQTPKSPGHDILSRYHLRLDPEGGGAPFYLRALSEGERTDVENHALRASHAHRKELRDQESAAFLAHLSFLDDFTLSELREQVVAGSEMVAWVRAYRAIPLPPTTPSVVSEAPSDDPLLDRENALLSPEETAAGAVERVNKERLRLVEEDQKATEARVATLDRDALLAEARTLVIQARANEVYSKAAARAVVAFAVYEDASYKTRAFPLGTYLPAPLQDALYAQYGEVGNVPTTFLTTRR